jgi:hypothetical protein
MEWARMLAYVTGMPRCRPCRAWRCQLQECAAEKFHGFLQECLRLDQSGFAHEDLTPWPISRGGSNGRPIANLIDGVFGSDNASRSLIF